MKDHRSEKVKEICTRHVQNGCHAVCPLSTACKPRAFDTKEVYDARMNHEAEILEVKK